MVEKKLSVKINSYEKQCLPATTLNKKHLLKHFVPSTYTLERFLQLLCLKVSKSSESLVFGHRKRAYSISILWSTESAIGRFL